MSQVKLRIKQSDHRQKTVNGFAEAIGLTYYGEHLTLRFIRGAQWGSRTDQIQIDRNLAEQLARLLNDELDDFAV